jgi:hypothetical protein
MMFPWASVTWGGIVSEGFCVINGRPLIQNRLAETQAAQALSTKL